MPAANKEGQRPEPRRRRLLTRVLEAVRDMPERSGCSAKQILGVLNRHTSAKTEVDKARLVTALKKGVQMGVVTYRGGRYRLPATTKRELCSRRRRRRSSCRRSSGRGRRRRSTGRGRRRRRSSRRGRRRRRSSSSRRGRKRRRSSSGRRIRRRRRSGGRRRRRRSVCNRRRGRRSRSRGRRCRVRRRSRRRCTSASGLQEASKSDSAPGLIPRGGGGTDRGGVPLAG